MTLATLAAAVHEADSRLGAHDSVCQAWRYDLDCLKHRQLEHDWQDADDRYQAALVRVVGPIS